MHVSMCMLPKKQSCWKIPLFICLVLHTCLFSALLYSETDTCTVGTCLFLFHIQPRVYTSTLLGRLYLDICLTVDKFPATKNRPKHLCWIESVTTEILSKFNRCHNTKLVCLVHVALTLTVFYIDIYCYAVLLVTILLGVLVLICTSGQAAADPVLLFSLV